MNRNSFIAQDGSQQSKSSRSLHLPLQPLRGTPASKRFRRCQDLKGFNTQHADRKIVLCLSLGIASVSFYFALDKKWNHGYQYVDFGINGAELAIVGNALDKGIFLGTGQHE